LPYWNTTPYIIKININLASTEWDSLKESPPGEIRYFTLDLSGSTGTSIISADSSRGNGNIVSVILPDGLNNIGNYAFYNCIELESINIPNSVTSIGEWAFIGNKSLKNIIIPSGVTSIGGMAFQDCSSLISVTFNGAYTTLNFMSGGYENNSAFPGDLGDKYLAGGIGTYTRPNGDSQIWTKQ
jgi:hypothetical protein